MHRPAIGLKNRQQRKIPESARFCLKKTAFATEPVVKNGVDFDELAHV
jgi:hypothetical protein